MSGRVCVRGAWLLLPPHWLRPRAAKPPLSCLVCLVLATTGRGCRSSVRIVNAGRLQGSDADAAELPKGQAVERDAAAQGAADHDERNAEVRHGRNSPRRGRPPRRSRGGQCQPAMHSCKQSCTCCRGTSTIAVHATARVSNTNLLCMGHECTSGDVACPRMHVVATRLLPRVCPTAARQGRSA